MTTQTNPINCNSRRIKNKYYKSHPLHCHRNNQCRNAEGKEKNCICAMDGKGYCELLEGDSELDNYASSCYFLSNEKAFAWYLYIDLFPIIHKVPKCAQHLFKEIQILKNYSEMLDIDTKETFL